MISKVENGLTEKFHFEICASDHTWSNKGRNNNNLLQKNVNYTQQS